MQNTRRKLAEMLSVKKADKIIYSTISTIQSKYSWF